MKKLVLFFTKHTSGSVYKLFRLIYRAFHRLGLLCQTGLYYLFRLFPIQDKVVASTFRGRRYGDNSQFIAEKLHELSPDTTIVWITQKGYSYPVPEYMKTVDYYSTIKKIYTYATARVWVNTHRMEQSMRKRKHQLFIETWHGGLGIKKIELDCKESPEPWELKELSNTAGMADLFISNSDHLTGIYRNAFAYRGTVWKCGYPKNDILIRGSESAKDSVRRFFGIPADAKIVVYAPTFRTNMKREELLSDVFTMDYDRVRNTLEKNWGGTWYVLVKWHPIMQQFINDSYENNVINATEYPDMQELILASDAFISDYSSCIFDAALRGIPCFTYATDFARYRQDRGVYYEMDELPFPYAKNNDELEEAIVSFEKEQYAEKWRSFESRTGLHETGHAAEDIASVINAYLKGDLAPLRKIQSEA